MSEFSAFIRPLLGLLFIWTGYRRLRNPARFLKAAPATDKPTDSAAGAATLDLKPIRRAGVGWVLFGLVVLWFSPVHLRVTPTRSASAATSPPAMKAYQLASEFAGKHRIPGMAIAIVADGKETVFGLGTRSLFSGDEVDGDTLFEIGSITKTFTGILLAKMITEKKLMLEDPISKHLPAGTNVGGSEQNPIRLKHLTTHSAGLPMMPPNYVSIKRALRILAGLDPYNNYSEAELLESIKTPQLIFETGKKGEYSNYGIGLLGWILASNSKGSYEEVILREVCRPLGMTNSTITIGSEHRDRFARGYSGVLALGPLRFGRPSAYWNLSNAFAGAGALRSSGNDMLKYLKANMGLNQTPLDEAIRLSHQKLFEYDSGHDIGMNWLIRKPKDKLPAVTWHNGGTGGFRSFIGFTEDKRFGVVVLSGKDTEVDSLGVSILTALTAGNPDDNKQTSK